jgi:pimeloyl-ACP methyl ester carboxylesterase
MQFGISRSAVIWGVMIGMAAFVSGKDVHAANQIRPAVREMEISAGTVTLFLRIAGDPSNGNVLIGVNGGPGQSSNYMRGLETLAGAGWAVVTYDQRGAGRSSEPADGYGLDEHAADLEAVRRAVGTEAAHIFGHSWGGVIAMHHAAQYPGSVRSLILMGSGPPAREEVQHGQALLSQRIADLRERGVIAGEPPERLKDKILFILPAYFSDPEFPVPPELQNTEINPAAHQRTLATVGHWNIRAEAAELTLPVLLLWGEDDPFGPAVAEATKRALSCAKVEFAVLKECGHYWHEREDIFFYHVRNFLERHSGSRGPE